MTNKIKWIIQNVFNSFGYEIRRKNDAFAIQKELIRRGEPVIFDVGAHIGSVTEKYRKLFPLASIYCFEPFPKSFEQLKSNIADDPRTIAYRIAMSDTKGKAILNVNTSTMTNSLLHTDIRGEFYWGEALLNTIDEEEIDTISIDCFSEENKINFIDILKLDVQGYEFAILNGAKKMLFSQSVSLIYTEIIMAPTYQGQYKLHEYLSLLDSFGYELLDLYNPVRRRKQLIQTDILFLSTKFKQECPEMLV